MPKLKEKFFNKPDTLTQEKKSLGEAIKSGGMLKSAKRKKGVKTDTEKEALIESMMGCLLYTSPSPRDLGKSRMPSSA